MFEPRMNYYAAYPEGIAALTAFGHVINNSGLEASLLELIKVRASQLNGCAYCIDMHTQDAIAAGETTQRLFSLDAWRESPFYTPRERAALQWTESVTNVQQGHVPEAVFTEARAHFAEHELTKLTLAIGLINTWNRMAIAFRPVVGRYKPETNKG
jgi:AhpD family alkylhydroperoxidase